MYVGRGRTRVSRLEYMFAARTVGCCRYKSEVKKSVRYLARPRSYDGFMLVLRDE